MRQLIVLLLFLWPVVPPAVAAAEESAPEPESWSGIPLMPGTHSGREAHGTYLAAVDVPCEDAETWYRGRMEKDGWTVTVADRSAKSPVGGGPMVRLAIKRGDEEVSVMLIYSVKSKYTMMVLSRVSPADEE